MRRLCGTEKLTGVYMAEQDDIPIWVKSAVKVWTEDDSGAVDREQLPSAWKRIFRWDEFDPEKAEEKFYCGGDSWYLFPGGRIGIYTCTGAEIHVWPYRQRDMLEKRAQELSGLRALCREVAPIVHEMIPVTNCTHRPDDCCDSLCADQVRMAELYARLILAGREA